MFKKGRAAKRRARTTEPDAEDDRAVSIKQPKSQLKGALHFSSETARTTDGNDAYKGTGDIRADDGAEAFRTLQEETETHLDRRAQKEASMRGAAHDDGKYHGQAGYKDWKEGLRRENKVAVHGPQRVSTFVRTTIRVDYQPDICKDYKETGFCSYGDTCKFLHDRGDYKAGWEIDKEWEAQQAAKREKAAQRLLDGRAADESSESDGGDSNDEDELPFACFICRRNWEDCESRPVKTNCEHYFCESCALSRFSKNKRCAVCEKLTLGIYNSAPEIERRFELGKKRAGGPGATGGAWSTQEKEEGGGWTEEA